MKLSQEYASHYLSRGLGKVVMYTKSEERDLYSQYKEGDVRAGQQIVQGIIPYIISIAKKYKSYLRNTSMELDDLVSEGVMHATKCLETFDPDKAKFITFSKLHIHGGIRRHIYKNKKLVRTGIHGDENLYFKFQATMIRLFQELGEAATHDAIIKEAAEHLGETEEKLRDLSWKMSHHDIPLRFLETYGDYSSRFDGMEFVDDEENFGAYGCYSSPYDGIKLADDEEKQPDNLVIETHTRASLENSMAEVVLSLGEGPHCTILLDRFYHPQDSPQPLLREVGEQFGISRERVRQLQNEAFSSIRDSLEQVVIAHGMEEEFLNV